MDVAESVRQESSDNLSKTIGTEPDTESEGLIFTRAAPRISTVQELKMCSELELFGAISRAETWDK